MEITSAASGHPPRLCKPTPPDEYPTSHPSGPPPPKRRTWAGRGPQVQARKSANIILVWKAEPETRRRDEEDKGQ